MPSKTTPSILRPLATGSGSLPPDELLKAALAALDEALIVTDGAGNILFASPQVTHLWGYAPREIAGKKLHLLLAPEAARGGLPVANEASNGVVRQRQLEAYRRDGSSFPVEIRVVESSAPGRTQMIIAARDLSEVAGLRDRVRQFDKAVQTMQVGVALTDREQRILFANRALAEMHGYGIEELLGASMSMLAPEESSAPVEFREFKHLRSLKHESRNVRKDGSLFPAEVLSDLVTSAEGEPVGIVTIFQDITERKRAEEALRISEERYALAVRGANDGIWDWNLVTGDVYYAPRWKAMLGCEDETIGPTSEEWFRRVHPDDLGALRRRLDEHLAGQSRHFEAEYRMLHTDGSYLWMVARGLAVWDQSGEPLRLAGSQTDITDRKVYDPLTGLPNRALFLDRLAVAVSRARRRPGTSSCSVLFLDLDQFKVVNDSLGHATGDQLLVAIARRLTAALRPGDTLARLGSDEFAILLEEIHGVVEAVRLAEQLHQELALPFTLGEHELFASASIGIAVGTGSEHDPSDVLRDADAAMYRAKSAGRGRLQIFDKEMRVAAQTQLRLETDLRRALERGEFIVHYQPIVSLRNNQVVGFEALVRWQHPERGLLAPMEFIRAAEETGLIRTLGPWVVGEACRQLAAWRKVHGVELPVGMSVNLSPILFEREEVVAQVAGFLNASGIEGARLQLEITESLLIENPKAANELLGDLRRLGVRISIDDFGTGYSSLAYLHRFPIDTLKIDRSFIAQLGGKGREDVLVRTILHLAAELGLEVVAEGVETAEQRRCLKAWKCDLIQGYFFRPPLPAAEAEKLLEPLPRRRKR